MKKMAVRSLSALLLALSLGLGLAQVVRDGTSLLLTDARSEVIVGFGEVAGGRLELQLAPEAGGFVMLIIQPDGSVDTVQGQLVGAEVMLELAGERLSLAQFLSRNEIALKLRLVAGDTFEAGQADDEMLSEPTEDEPDDENDDSGDDDAAEDDDDGDGANPGDDSSDAGDDGDADEDEEDNGEEDNGDNNDGDGDSSGAGQGDDSDNNDDEADGGNDAGDSDGDAGDAEDGGGGGED